MTASVPEVFRGLWRRRLLETPKHTDRTTMVYWLQTGSLYADLRIPDPRVIAGQQGFAGQLLVDDDILTWERWLDLQPSGAMDVGRVHFEGECLVEQGVHAEYREEWERVVPWSRDTIALKLEAELGPRGHAISRAGVLVAAQGHFMYALDRVRPMSVADGRRELADDATIQADTSLDCVIDFGNYSADNEWQITHSTRLLHESLGFAELDGIWRRDDARHYLQMKAGGVFRRWQVIEQGPAFRGLPGTR